MREFQRGAVRLHILHHAAEAEVHGAWLTHELASHGYRISPGTLYPTLHRLEAEGLTIDPSRRLVELDGRSVQLTYVEFELLRTMASSPGRVFSRKMLLEELWGGSEYREPRTIDVHVRHLREKLERDPGEPELIHTVRGAGYRFRER